MSRKHVGAVFFVLMMTVLLIGIVVGDEQQQITTSIPDTGQGICYDNTQQIVCPPAGGAFFGQDAQYAGPQPSYMDNGDGTVTDLVTGLMWQKSPGAKKTYAEAVAGAASLNFAGYTDWRLPTIKELYSLILFNGTDVSICMNGQVCDGIPFIDTRYFDFVYGDTSTGDRIIDVQYWSSTEYVSTAMNGAATVFGVNFADGRIKGYPRDAGIDGPKTEFVLYVRGGMNYGVNSFVDNGDGTITDNATGLMWMQTDSGQGINWHDALAYCEALSQAGYDDWRLPNAKELQSIVDYSRSPATTNSAAIDPLFSATPITDEGGSPDYPFYWSSTTHVSSDGSGESGAYIAFGKALGFMSFGGGPVTLMDVHGAGAQRSDPKIGNPADYPEGHGPQGDVIRIFNYTRCVRGGSVTLDVDGDPTSTRPSVAIDSGTTGGQGAPSTGQGGSNAPGNGQPGGNQPAGQPGGGTPPQEAINACTGVSQGAACQFTTPQGTITGTCMQVQGQQLACIPAGGAPNN